MRKAYRTSFNKAKNRMAEGNLIRVKPSFEREGEWLESIGADIDPVWLDKGLVYMILKSRWTEFGDGIPLWQGTLLVGEKAVKTEQLCSYINHVFELVKQ